VVADRLAGDQVLALGAVAGRPDPVVRGLHARVDRDGAALAERDAGRPGQADRRPGAEAEHDQVGLERPLGGPDGPDPPVALDRRHLLLQEELDPEVANRLGDELAHVGIDPLHHLGGGLDQGGGDTPVDQGLGRLQADVAAADDHRPPRAGVDRPAQLDAVLEHRQPEHARQVDAVDRRSQRLGAGGHHQHVPRLLDHPVAVQVADPDPPGLQVDGVDLVAGPDLDALGGELLGSPGDQGAPVLDHVAGVVGEPAGRVGGVPAPLEGDNLQLLGLAAPARLGGRAHPGRVAPDHHHARSCHGPSSSPAAGG
jgi:hypothetical protein